KGRVSAISRFKHSSRSERHSIAVVTSNGGVRLRAAMPECPDWRRHNQPAGAVDVAISSVRFPGVVRLLAGSRDRTPARLPFSGGTAVTRIIPGISEHVIR